MEHLRVTEVLYPFSGLKYVDPTILENAAARGTKVHKICEGIVNGIDGWDCDEELTGYVQSFRKWWGRGQDVLACEERMFCDDLGITGKTDLIVNFQNRTYIVDLKTSMSESKSWMLQGSVYSYLAKKAGYEIQGIMFMRLRRDGSEPKYHYYEENMDLFKECLNVYKYFFAKKPRASVEKTS